MQLPDAFIVVVVYGLEQFGFIVDQLNCKTQEVIRIESVC